MKYLTRLFILALISALLMGCSHYTGSNGKQYHTGSGIYFDKHPSSEEN